MRVGTRTPVSPIQGAIPVPEETAVLVNISETEYYAERTFGNYRIAGCKPGQDFVLLEVHARRIVIDRGDRPPGKKDPFKNTQQEIAHAVEIGEDLVRQWNTDIWGIGSTPTGEVAGEEVRGFAGVFVADGVRPTEDELAMAKDLLAKCDEQLTQRADSEWDQFHSPMTIHMGWKRAARRLGVDAAWLYTVANKTKLPDCPHCGSKLLTLTATVCSVCHRDVVTPSAPPAARRKAARAAGRSRSAESPNAAD
jgi:hypothetical protein